MGQKLTVEQVISTPADDDNCSYDNCIPLTEFVASGKVATVFGKVRTSTELMTIASNAGFDLKTGKARTSMEYGGAIVAYVDGKETTLFWGV